MSVAMYSWRMVAPERPLGLGGASHAVVLRRSTGPGLTKT
jgi:hypothetical protein